MKSNSICRSEQELQSTKEMTVTNQKECNSLCDEHQECRFYSFDGNNTCRFYNACDYPYLTSTNNNVIYKKITKGRTTLKIWCICLRLKN